MELETNHFKLFALFRSLVDIANKYDIAHSAPILEECARYALVFKTQTSGEPLCETIIHENERLDLYSDLFYALLTGINEQKNKILAFYLWTFDFNFELQCVNPFYHRKLLYRALVRFYKLEITSTSQQVLPPLDHLSRSIMGHPLIKKMLVQCVKSATTPLLEANPVRICAVCAKNGIRMEPLCANFLFEQDKTFHFGIHEYVKLSKYRLQYYATGLYSNCNTSCNTTGPFSPCLYTPVPPFTQSIRSTWITFYANKNRASARENKILERKAGTSYKNTCLCTHPQCQMRKKHFSGELLGLLRLTVWRSLTFKKHFSRELLGLLRLTVWRSLTFVTTAHTLCVTSIIVIVLFSDEFQGILLITKTRTDATTMINEILVKPNSELKPNLNHKVAVSTHTSSISAKSISLRSRETSKDLEAKSRKRQRTKISWKGSAVVYEMQISETADEEKVVQQVLRGHPTGVGRKPLTPRDKS
ncbi:hypothetical protein WN51_07765 [Melipona quadrifasciata]|uniref:Uncharacterized protein n=1 Tax=Melipona quadrifasciata TaxID=166423 RepID=A0A0M9A916_9HYME|nr:hypothetical protein WN51_07765 [Melipona quadrifasciata]